ncbi:MAG: VOC family protein [Sinobacteraceae bacterium]|nr:VOC family protein [Nevskiaceae bacterium]
MSATAFKPIPEGMHTVTPHLICKGAAKAIEFYQRAFGATELSRVAGPDGKLMHAAIRIGDSVVFLVDEMPHCGVLGPEGRSGSTVFVHLYVQDADAAAARAVDAGANVLMPVQEMFWGDRYGQLQDPFGHLWSIATHVREVSPAEMQQAVQAMAGRAA